MLSTSLSQMTVEVGIGFTVCLVSDSAGTSFGSSFACFDTKLVSEDTLAVTPLVQNKYIKS